MAMCHLVSVWVVISERDVRDDLTSLTWIMEMRRKRMRMAVETRMMLNCNS